MAAGPKLYFNKGSIVDAFNFTADDLTVVGVARALSRINRFTGNGAFTSSVAQHSVVLSYVVPRHLRKAALLHDVPEIFTGEVPHPFKLLCPDFMAHEERIIRRVAEVFKVPYEQFEELKPFDRRLGRDEARAIFEEATVADGLGVPYEPMTPREAEDAFVRRFFELFVEDDND